MSSAVPAERMAYIGIEPCGCVTCATVDNPDRKRDVAKEIAKWVRWGLTLERVPVEVARSRLTFHTCSNADSKQGA